MSVERNKDGSISIRSNKGVAVIGRIVGVSNDKREEKFRQWTEDCAELVTSCPHTDGETVQYFLQQCDALPIALDDRRMKRIKLNVIMNHYKDKLEHRPSEFSFDMIDEEIEKWHKEDNAMHEEAMNSSPERFGLKMIGYYLPHTERNTVFYEEAILEAQKHIKPTKINHAQIEIQDICFFFEETTGHCQSSGGGSSLMNTLIVFRGLSEDDIKERSPRFLGYISALREMGNLPDFIGE